MFNINKFLKFYKTISLIFTIVLFAMTFFGLFFNLLGLPIVYSISMRISIVTIFIWVFVLVAYGIVQYKMQFFKTSIAISIYIFTVCVLLAFISTVFKCNFSYFSFSYLEKMIMSLSFLGAVVIFSHSAVDAKIMKLLSLLSWAFILVSLLLFIVKFSKLTIHVKSISFNSSNPNEAALNFLIMGTLSLYGFALFANKILKYTSVVVFIISLFLIYITECRNVFVGLVFATLVLIIRSFIKKRSMTNFENAIFALLPLIVFLIYLLIAYQFENQTVVFGGKSLDTRKLIWDEGLRMFSKSPIFGNYYYFNVTYQIMYGGKIGGLNQLHNSAIDALSTFGLPYFLLQQILIFRFLCFKNNTCYHKNSLLPLSFGLCLIYGGLFEGAFYLNGCCISAPILLSLRQNISVETRESTQYSNYRGEINI